MEEVPLETLRARMSEYMRRAQDGERIVITEEGRPVALLMPMAGGEPVKRAWDLVQAGAASWSGGKPLGSRNRPRPRGLSASGVVLEDRR